MSEKKEVTLLKEEISALNIAEKLSITTPEHMTNAVKVLSVLNQALDRLTKDKEKLTKPINELLKEIRGRYKPHETRLEAAIAHFRKEMSRYQTEATKIAAQEEDKIVDRIGTGKGKLKPETAVRKLEEVERPEDKITTDQGSVSFMKVKKFEVEDLSKIPVEYLLANEVAIRKAMKEGIEIPGVRYFTEEVPRNSR